MLNDKYELVMLYAIWSHSMKDTDLFEENTLWLYPFRN